MAAEEKKPKTMRILALDYLRGFDILLMIIIHGLSYWCKPDSIWLYGLVGPYVGTLAVIGYVFVSGIGFGFSWVKSNAAGVPSKEQHLKSFSHSMILFIISIGYNLGSSFGAGYKGIGPFSWHILQCLVFSRLLSQIFMKLKKNARFFVALVLVAFSSLLLNWINFGNSSNLFHQILFVVLYMPLEYYPIIVFYPIFLIGTVIGEGIFTVSKDQAKIMAFIKQWFVIGVTLLITGLILGLQLETSTPYNGRDLLALLNINPAFHFTEYPLLLDLDSYAWVLFGVGEQIILIILFMCYLDLNAARNKKYSLAKRNLFYLFGAYSLTIFLGHYMIFLIPVQMDAEFLWLSDIVLVSIVYVAVLLLDRAGKGKYSLEFIMGIGGEMLYRKLNRIGTHKAKRIPPATVGTESPSPSDKIS